MTIAHTLLHSGMAMAGVWWVGAACLVIGCGGAPLESVVEESADELGATRTITLTLGSGAAEDSPRLRQGVTAGFTCEEPFEGIAGKRIECARGNERLVVLDRAGDGALVYQGSAKRETFACTRTQGALRCTTKKPSTGGHGGLASPFASSVAGISIPNTHAIEGAPRLLRGMAPRSDAHYDELERRGVDAVLIFKNATGQGDDVQDELTELQGRGFAASRVKHVPFRWKDVASFKEACEQTVEALAFLRAEESARRTTFFHCTVGEDRTGYLAALARLARDPQADPSELFQREACERGYAEGNPMKPSFVTRTVSEELTPLYRKMAFLIRSGALDPDAPDASICTRDPSRTRAFTTDPTLDEDRYTCGTSTAFAP